MIEWYENGQKKEEASWKDGKLDGVLTVISFVVSPVGQRVVKGLTLSPQPSIIQVK